MSDKNSVTAGEAAELIAKELKQHGKWGFTVLSCLIWRMAEERNDIRLGGNDGKRLEDTKGYRRLAVEEAETQVNENVERKGLFGSFFSLFRQGES